MSKRKIGIMAAAIVLLMVGAVWALRGRTDPQVEKLKRMLADGPPSPAQREQFRQEMQKLTPDQRRQLGQEMGQQWQRRANERAKGYFALPPDKRQDYLDKRIAEDEQRRKEREEQRKQRQQQAQGGQGGNPGAAKQGPGMGPGQGPSGPGNPGGGPGGGQNQSPEARSAGRNQFLDNTSPQQRAQNMAYRAAMQQRRLQLGLPASPFGGRGFGR
jgi:hypothetical protein